MGAFLAWEPNGSSPAAASQSGVHRRPSPRVDPWERRRVTLGCQAFVAMVQTAYLGERENLAILRTLHWS